MCGTPAIIGRVSERSPAEYINEHQAELVTLDEAGFLLAVQAIAPLADTDSGVWEDESAWNEAMRLVAAADVVGERGWRSAISLIFERAARGDLFGMMQSIRHGPEQAMGDDLDDFAAILEPLAAHPRSGTRQWSVRELGILRLERSRGVLETALTDPVEDVSEEALSSLQMLDQRST